MIPAAMKTKRMQFALFTLPLISTLFVALPVAARNELNDKIDSNIQDWLGTYKHLHQNPELSTEEKETAALVTAQLKKLGYEVAP
jgi:hypothetical protein